VACLGAAMSDAVPSPPDPARPETFLVFAAMKNEGAFIVEWVSWYRAMGFSVLVGINDCTDHSPALLDLLAQAGWLQVFSHAPPKDVPPKASAHRAMRAHPAMTTADWLLICDVDEFLVLHQGDGSIAGYLDAMGRDFLGMAFHWQCFGNSGWQKYQPGLTHRQFLRCGPGQRQVNAMFKTLIHDPLRFRKYSDHSPFEFDGVWGEGRNLIVDSERRVIDKFQTEPQPIRFSTVEQITHKTAQMNHYIIRSDEHFALKRGTKSASAFKDRYTDQFYRARNKNGMKDNSALAWASRFDPVHAQAMAIPGVARLHHLCCADYVARLLGPGGARPQDDPRWQFHMAQAG